MSFLTRIFGDPHLREVKKLRRHVEAVNSEAKNMEALADDQFPEYTARFKERIARGESLDDLLPEVFALAREAAWRTLGMRPFDVQVLGGVVLHQGRIAEMKTGEGKTLVATMPAYLNALTGKGVHIVTVNDYLAGRDREWMGPVYEFLGLSVGTIMHGMKPEERKEAYAADITYGTNNEFGFDYLRDNMVIYKDNLVQRPLHYAIVDEVDSILIDEARTPLIISGAGEESTDQYARYASFVSRLQRDSDYEVDEKAQNVELTEKGFARVEKILGISNLEEADERDDIESHIRQALKAHVLMKRDRDYVVKDGEVIIVDEFTGRLMFGRRYSEGLHQAIEAKEKVKVARESKTLASITFQNYFRMYEKLSGMTGTAVTEEEEFRKIYGMDVVIVPTNVPMVRKDLPDVIYRTERAKFQAVLEEIEACHARKQPVLVGTISIEKSEELSRLLSKKGITHHVLNAKHHDKEADIIAQAGRVGAATIATNMAGRGTDIVLGGNPAALARQEMRRRGYPPEVVAGAVELGPCDEEVAEARQVYQELLARFKETADAEYREVVEAGGLHIIGTERHEARRIDNQLRGRAGRQGDPGSSRFFISLEDDLMRLFGSDNVSGIMERLGLEEDVPIEHPMISRAIENAQKKVEGRNFEIRKHILEYDDVLNQQREVIYRQRRQVLEGENLRDNILQMMNDVLENALALYLGDRTIEEDGDLQGLRNYVQRIFLPGKSLPDEDWQDFALEEIQEKLFALVQESYAEREKEAGAEFMRELERVVLLRTVDSKWMDHIDMMHDLRQGVWLRSFGQQDPLLEYKMEAYEMFQEMIRSIQEDVIRLLFHLKIDRAPSLRPAPAVSLPAAGAAAGGGGGAFKETGSGGNSGTGPVQRGRATTTPRGARRRDKVGRNDPCPCGSGKKYKRCCGA
ncbi:MAG: preprotein translocase subunit SecA [Firmicutes bacterium]|nr:preprotein translocase subunit SecA [Bacillota bacterium]